MAIDVQSPPRRPSALLAQWLHRLAPQGLNSNTQFFLVFLGALGLHLLLAPAFMRSAALPEPGDSGENLPAPALTSILPEAPPQIVPVKSSPKSSKASVILSDEAAAQGTVRNDPEADTPLANPAIAKPVLPAAPVAPVAPAAPATTESVAASAVRPAPAPVNSTPPPPVTPSLTDLIGAAASAPQRDAAEAEPAAASSKEGVRSFRALP